jgi:hypothetical protein
MHRNPMGGHGHQLKIERLDKMVKAGRVTEDEADRLRAAARGGDLDEAVREIQLKHARARVDAAVENGRLSQGEADSLVQRITNGESPRLLRGLRRRSL